MIRGRLQRYKNQLGVGMARLLDPTRRPIWLERLFQLLPPGGP